MDEESVCNACGSPKVTHRCDRYLSEEEKEKHGWMYHCALHLCLFCEPLKEKT